MTGSRRSDGETSATRPWACHAGACGWHVVYEAMMKEHEQVKLILQEEMLKAQERGHVKI